MGLDNLLDGKTIVMAVAASLTAYVFYGHINLTAKVDTIDTKQVQVMGEQRDLWSKYNADLDDKVDFMKDYFEFKVNNEARWTDYWKERYKELSKSE